MNSVGRTVNTDEESVRYFIDKMFHQTELYWKRANILLLINAAVIGLVGKMLTDSDELTDSGKTLYLGISVIGVILSVLWLFMQIVSKFNEDKWKYDALRILCKTGNEELAAKYSVSLGFNTEINSESVQDKTGLKQPKNYLKLSASGFMNIIVGVFVAVWAVFLVYSLIIY